MGPKHDSAGARFQRSVEEILSPPEDAPEDEGEDAKEQKHDEETHGGDS